jgi:hypothetical protein
VAVIGAKGHKGLVFVYCRLIGAATDFPIIIVEKDDEILEGPCSFLLVRRDQRLNVAVVACDHTLEMTGIAMEAGAVPIMFGRLGYLFVTVLALGVHGAGGEHAVVWLAVPMHFTATVAIRAEHTFLQMDIRKLKLSLLVKSSVALLTGVRNNSRLRSCRIPVAPVTGRDVTGGTACLFVRNAAVWTEPVGLLVPPLHSPGGPMQTRGKGNGW